MKYGIMSMQRIYNYGSWLQSYALANVIEEVSSKRPCFVDYKEGRPVSAKGKGFIKYAVRKGKICCAELVSSNSFFASLTLSEHVKHVCKFKHIYQKELLGTIKRSYSSELDTLIIGSDEVFNCLQDNPRVGFSPALFGADSSAKKTVSYAASFGNTTLEKLKKAGKDKEISDYLSKLDDISVRDENSRQTVKALCGRDAQLHLDPVLIYDFTKEINAPSKFSPIDEKYMIVYTYNGRLSQEECQAIRKYADSRALKVVGINGNYDILDKMVYDSPLNVLKWFNHAECIVSDTFHGTIFSVINGKPFATIVRKSENGSYGNHEKLYDLLCRLCLKERIANTPLEISAVLDSPIDYTSAKQVIKEEKERTRAYLRSVLEV